MVEEFGSEVERRRFALGLVGRGVGIGEAARRVGRSRQWLSKWKKRVEQGDGVEGRSRRPLRSPNQTSSRMTGVVLRYRDELEDDPVASVGGMSILASMERDAVSAIPSLRTIERVLQREGRSRPYEKPTRTSNRVLPLPDIGSQPGIWQQADWVQDRYLEGAIVFNSLQICDVGSQAIAAGQYSRRTVVNAVKFLIERAWPVISIPNAISIDNAFVKTTHPNNPWTAWTRACLFFGVEVVVSPPSELGWTNTVEAVNNLWQARTIRRHHCDSIDELRRYSNLACDWFNTKRPVLDPNICGTRYPAELIAAHRDQLRWPPDITIADYLTPKGQLHIPLTHGRITFLRRVENETILIAHTRWATPNLSDGQLVVASVTTADATLTIRHRGEQITIHPYPINHPISDPHYPPQPTSVYHHA